MNQNIQNVSDYFQSQVFKIPSDIKVEIVTLPNSLILKTKKNSLNTGETKEKLKAILNESEILEKLQEISKETSSQPSVDPWWERSSPNVFLKLSGPLGSTLINLQKFDKFGLCFFELGESKPKGEILLKVSIKNLTKPSTQSSKNPQEGTETKLQALETQSASENKTSLKISKKSSAFFHLFNSVYKQSIEGVLQGYVLYLELHGVGFRGTLHERSSLVSQKSILSTSKSQTRSKEFSKKYIEFKLGQSHDIFYEIPSNIQVFMVKPTLIGLYGIDKENLSHVGADIRNLKLPDSYKGKGIRYKDEVIKTKIGKKK